MALRFVLILVFASLVAIFTMQNAADVAINFISWQIAVPQALVILVSVLFGAATAYLLGGVQSMRAKGQLKESLEKCQALEGEKSLLERQILDMEEDEEEAQMAINIAPGGSVEMAKTEEDPSERTPIA